MPNSYSDLAQEPQAQSPQSALLESYPFFTTHQFRSTVIGDITVFNFTDQNENMSSRLTAQVIIPHKLMLKPRMNVSSNMNPFSNVGAREAGDPK
jgi:hypothetical protein